MVQQNKTACSVFFELYPEVLDAIIKANDGDSTPYGNDQISTELQDKFSEIFEKEVIVFPTASGTAANALALSTMTPSFGNIYCHKLSHINTDECGAPEFYTGNIGNFDSHSEL